MTESNSKSLVQLNDQEKAVLAAVLSHFHCGKGQINLPEFLKGNVDALCWSDESIHLQLYLPLEGYLQSQKMRDMFYVSRIPITNIAKKWTIHSDVVDGEVLNLSNIRDLVENMAFSVGIYTVLKNAKVKADSGVSLLAVHKRAKFQSNVTFYLLDVTIDHPFIKGYGTIRLVEIDAVSGSAGVSKSSLVEVTNEERSKDERDIASFFNENGRFSDLKSLIRAASKESNTTVRPINPNREIERDIGRG